MLTKDESPLSKGYQPVIWNFKLLAHDMLGGFGGMGEGMSVQIAPDGRRVIWLAHESAPKNFTAVDVTDPKNPNAAAHSGIFIIKAGTSAETVQASNQPNSNPAIPPAPVSVTASVRNCQMMSARRAPRAFRIPISRVRSVTATSIMFITPTPPTMNAIEEMISITPKVTMYCVSLSRFCSWFIQ